MARIQQTVMILVGVAASWWMLSQLLGLFREFANVLAIFGFAWMLNLLLEPMVDWLSRYIRRSVAWGVGYICVLLALVALGAPLASQASALPAALPGVLESTTAQVDRFLVWLSRHSIAVPDSAERVLASGELAQQMGTTILSWSLALLSISGQTLLVIGVAAAMSAGDDSLRAIVRAMLPERWMNDVLWLYDDVRRTYSAGIRGHLAIWGLGMLLSMGTMALFNTPNLLLWVGPLALIRIIPYLGGILGGALTGIILLVTLPWPMSLAPVLIVLIGQNLMGYIIEPRLLGRALRLSPGLVLFVVLAGWQVGGVAGIAFGLPAVAVVQALAERIINRREQLRAAAEQGGPLPAADSAPARPTSLPVTPSSGSLKERATGPS
jgi:predicted PurR-regulated permease PerM